jgi:hypothetical protein
MTIERAETLKQGEYVHHVSKKNADGTPMRARVTSVKTWKTRPNEINVHIKRGMYEYAVFTADELGQIEPGYGS